MNTSRAKVGIIGCGNISNIYCLANTKFHNLEVVALADVRPEAAQKKAEEHKIARHLTPEQLVAEPDIDIVVNLTIPAAGMAAPATAPATAPAATRSGYQVAPGDSLNAIAARMGGSPSPLAAAHSLDPAG